MPDSKHEWFSLTALAVCVAVGGYIAIAYWVTLGRLDEAFFMVDKASMRFQLQIGIAVGLAVVLAFAAAIVFQLAGSPAIASWIAGGFTIIGIFFAIGLGSFAGVGLALLSGTAVYFLRQQLTAQAVEELDTDLP